MHVRELSIGSIEDICFKVSFTKFEDIFDIRVHKIPNVGTG